MVCPAEIEVFVQPHEPAVCNRCLNEVNADILKLGVQSVTGAECMFRCNLPSDRQPWFECKMAIQVKILESQTGSHVQVVGQVDLRLSKCLRGAGIAASFRHLAINAGKRVPAVHVEVVEQPRVRNAAPERVPGAEFDVQGS